MADTTLLQPRTRDADVGGPAAGRTSRLSAWVAIAAVVVGLAFAPPWRGIGDLPEGFAGRLLSGVLERQVGEAWTDVGVGELVPTGTRVRSGGGARLAIDGGALALAAGSRAVLDGVTDLEAGSVLTVTEGVDRAVRIGAITAFGRGAWRVDADGAPRVGVYDGGVGLRVQGDAERALALSRLEQADLIAGGLPADPLPLRYSTDDDWDVQLLPGVLAIDRQAAQIRSTLAGRYGGDPVPEGFYLDFALVGDALTDALPRYGETAGDGRIGPPADVLLGVIVTDLVRRGAALPIDEAIDRVTALRADGATWGIVLAVHDLGADALRDAADLALREAPATAPAAPATAPDTTPTEAPTGPDTGGTEPTEAPTADEPEPEPSPEPPPTDDDEPTGPCELEPCEPVDDTVDDLTDLLDEEAPGTGDTVDDLISEVPTILPPGGGDEEATDLLGDD